MLINNIRTYDLRDFGRDAAAALAEQANEPVSRIVDHDPRFGRYFDHPAVRPLLEVVLGEAYRHIDNDLYCATDPLPSPPPSPAAGGARLLTLRTMQTHRPATLVARGTAGSPPTAAAIGSASASCARW